MDFVRSSWLVLWTVGVHGEGRLKGCASRWCAWEGLHCSFPRCFSHWGSTQRSRNAFAGQLLVGLAAPWMNSGPEK